MEAQRFIEVQDFSVLSETPKYPGSRSPALLDNALTLALGA